MPPILNRVNKQHEQGLGSLLRLAKKVVRNPTVKKLGKEALSRLLDLYSKGTSKIKNKKLKKILQLDMANSLVDMGVAWARQKLEKIC